MLVHKVMFVTTQPYFGHGLFQIFREYKKENTLVANLSRVHFEKLLASQLVRKLPGFYGISTFIIVFRRTPRLTSRAI